MKPYLKMGHTSKKTNWAANRLTEATIKQNEATIRAYAKEVEKLRAEVAYLKSKFVTKLPTTNI